MRIISRLISATNKELIKIQHHSTIHWHGPRQTELQYAQFQASQQQIDTQHQQLQDPIHHELQHAQCQTSQQQQYQQENNK